LQNRVNPFGELFASPSRGLFMGVRGGRFHRPDRTLGARRWASRRWICCLPRFRGVRLEVWGPRYTQLFFLDEVTALAAGHRPCAYCRRDAFRAYLGATGFSNAEALDMRLDAERRDGRAKRTHKGWLADLPDGAVVTVDGRAMALRAGRVLAWAPGAWCAASPLDPATIVDVLTPPTSLAALRRGYRPAWHISAGEAPA
jgi:hypothetical protein